MELQPKQQIIEQLKLASKILITTHEGLDGDALGSVLALNLILKKLGKEPKIVFSDSVPSVYNFLSEIKIVSNEIEGSSDFIISLDTSKATVEKLGYKQHEDQKKLNIVVTASSGTFRSENVSFSQGQPAFDLIFVLDTPDLERLGQIFDQNPDLFYHTTLINIDHHAGNTFFGKVNLVDLNATSTCEILVAVLESLGREKPLLDPEVATALLCGIITDTGSFQNQNTTPKSLTVAAQLVAAGAAQQEIIRQIYKTKPLSTLKLWGKILTRISEEKPYRFVYSTAPSADFSETQADLSESAGVIDELLKSAPEVDFVLLLVEKENGLSGHLRSVEKSFDVSAVAALFGGGGHPLAGAFQIEGQTLDQALPSILEKIKSYQAQRLGLGARR